MKKITRTLARAGIVAAAAAAVIGFGTPSFAQSWNGANPGYSAYGSADMGMSRERNYRYRDGYSAYGSVDGFAPNYGAFDRCMTDDGYGRRRPCADTGNQ